MSIIEDIFPEPTIAIELEPEELAVPLLEVLCLWEEEPRSSHMLHWGNIIGSAYLREYSGGYLKHVLKAVNEAWLWLQREGLIAPKPEGSPGWLYVTKRGRKFREMGNVQKFRAANLFPANIFDPTLASKSRPSFLRGDYDTAVFQAFKEVEVRVRKLSGATSEELGTTLMRKAFNPKNGPLRDPAQLQGEKQAASDLFAGAIGSFKNPSSHRDVNYDDPAEAAELIILADLLIRMAERRKPKV